MVRKFVFVEGAEPRVSPRRGARSGGAIGASARARGGAGAGMAVLQWLLLGVALAISAIAFSAAKASFDRQPSPAVER